VQHDREATAYTSPPSESPAAPTCTHTLCITQVVSVATDGSDDAKFGYVNADTEVLVEGEPLRRVDDAQLDELGYDDIGGCR
jgi:hypothetical protein